MREAVIVDAVRTPLGKRNGKLRNIHPAVLASIVMKTLVDRVAIDPAMIEQVVWGCALQIGDQASNIGRTAWLTAGFPVETGATTVDNRCGSSQNAIHLAANMIRTGFADIVIAGGVESMTRVPMGSTFGDGKGYPWPPEFRERFDVVQQGLSAEYVARKYGIDRRSMDEFSVESHHRAAEATRMGYLTSQIVPITTDDGIVMDADEGFRINASYDAISALSPAFDPSHSITAGNSSQITDGAAGILMMSQERCHDLNVRPRARILAEALVGCDPVLMLEGPIPATRMVTRRAGVTVQDIDLFEVNEAFASVPLAWLKEIGADSRKLNVNGGAIAIGHPLGASGARLMTHLLYELERRELRFGLEAMCCGGGLGTATMIERLS